MAQNAIDGLVDSLFPKTERAAKLAAKSTVMAVKAACIAAGSFTVITICFLIMGIQASCEVSRFALNRSKPYVKTGMTYVLALFVIVTLGFIDR